MNPVAGKSAADIHVAAFVQAAQKIGHVVELHNPVDVDSVANTKDRGFRRLRLRERMRRKVFYFVLDAFTWFADRWLARAAARAYANRKGEFDFVYARCGMTLFDSSGRIIARALEIPLVVELNSLPDRENEMRKRPLPLKFLVVRNTQMDLDAAQLVCVVSDLLARAVAQRAARGTPILVNPNGVDHTLFHPGVDGREFRKAIGVAPKDLLVGYAGSFQPWQGVLSLLRAFSVVARCERPSLRLLLIGDGEDLERARSLSKALSLERQVIFVGRRPHKEMPHALGACDILTAPYEHLESFYFSPLKIFEYMALGKPIIASRAGQLSTILSDRGNAMLVDPGAPENLAEVLAEVVADEELRTTLGRRAYEASLSHTWVENFKRMEKRLRDLIPRLGSVAGSLGGGSLE